MECPNLGEHCSEEMCKRLDFLPVKCDACQKIFCSKHMSYDDHSCPSAYKKNVQVPVCPLCNKPVPIQRGTLPDIAVGNHIDNDCQADKAQKRKKIFTNKCSSKGCKTKEIVPVVCRDCHQNFCFKHRHAVDHECAAIKLDRKGIFVNERRNNFPNGNQGSYRSTIQGSMSEDEALARALQKSLDDERRSRHRTENRNQQNCRLS